MKHTPGPWTIEKDCELIYILGDDVVCEIGSLSTPATTEQWKNAHLIAGAPEMLEALQRVLQLNFVGDEVYEQVHKAVDKALGQITCVHCGAKSDLRHKKGCVKATGGAE